MASVAGLLFLFALIFAPEQGLVAQWNRVRIQSQSVDRFLLLRWIADRDGTIQSNDCRRGILASPPTAKLIADQLGWARENPFRDQGKFG